MSTEDDAVVRAYAERYAELPDDELRQIVGGDVPWVEQGRYTFTARRAAHQVLRDRGVRDIPRLPLVDPEAKSLPMALRQGLVSVSIVLACGVMVAWGGVFPPESATDPEICDSARTALRETDFAFQHELALPDCVVDHAAATTVGDTVVTPVRFSACIELKDRHLQALREAAPRRVAILRRFVPRPAPGRYCVEAPVTLARWVNLEGHPWWVEIALLESE